MAFFDDVFRKTPWFSEKRHDWRQNVRDIDLKLFFLKSWVNFDHISYVTLLDIFDTEEDKVASNPSVFTQFFK